MNGDPRLPELFAQACDLAGEERAGWLAEVGRDDPELARELEELLEAAPGASERFETPAWEHLEEVPVEPPAPQRIGPYRIARELGRGGMGRVYLAEQEGAEFRRQVALKLLHRPVISEEDVRRFRREVQLLATLEHPGIARFLDGGQAPGGTWYLALEYVEGVDLLAFVASRDLSVDERVRLFLAVLDPVAYAHARSVVHRDLKPGNILVGQDGRPRLLDFGIAKLLDPAAGESVTVTGTEVRAFTPGYAAPEQVRGESVTAASDVHALGVILYELLAGSQPFPEAHSRAALESAVLTTEPVSPSKVAQRATRNRPPTSAEAARCPPPARGRIAADLDAICLKALRKEPAARYGDAEALAADLGRYLAGLPVAARRGGRRYRIGRFVRRNRSYLPAAAVVGLVVMLSPITFRSLPRPSPGLGSSGNAKIAVLPLKPVDPAQRDPALELALTESLIVKIAEAEDLDVKQLYAVRRFADLASDPIQAGRELQVDYVLASTYQVEEGRTRVTSHLIDVRSGEGDRTVRAETGARSVFAVQDAVSREIGNAVLTSLGRSATSLAPPRGTKNEEAYNLYNTALYLIDKMTRSDTAKAKEQLDRAVELDPSYAQAWAVRAQAYCQFGHLGGGPPMSIFPVAEAMLDEAFGLDPDNAVAYAVHGTIARDFHWDSRQAYEDLERSIALNPSSVVAHRILAGAYYRDGRFAEAVEAQKKALDLHPTSLLDLMVLGDYLVAAGRREEGIAQLNRVVAIDPSYGWAHSSLWRAHFVAGEAAQAFEHFLASSRIYGASDDAVARLKAIYEASGWVGVLRHELERMRARDPQGGYSPAKVYIAQLAAQLGETDLAFASLEDAMKQRLMGFAYLKVDHLLAPLRRDPRYEDLVRRAGL